nr:hypothetical protein CFP56_24121 [Quercus suber]
MVISLPDTYQAVKTRIPTLHTLQGPAAVKFFGCPELVAYMLESDNLTTLDVFSNLRVNKYCYQSIKSSPKLQRKMGLRYLAEKDVPATHVDKHNTIVAHLVHFFLDPAIFELRPYELVAEDTRLCSAGEVFRIHFERDYRKGCNVTRYNLPIGPKSRKTCKFHNDITKHIFVLNKHEQSWENIFVSPFPVEIEIKVTEIMEVETKTKRRRKTRVRERFSNFSTDFEKSKCLTLGHVVSLLNHGQRGRREGRLEHYGEACPSL